MSTQLKSDIRGGNTTFPAIDSDGYRNAKRHCCAGRM